MALAKISSTTPVIFPVSVLEPSGYVVTALKRAIPPSLIKSMAIIVMCIPLSFRLISNRYFHR